MQLLPLLSLFFVSLALSSPSDVLHIKKLVAEEPQLLDAKDFAGLVNVYTKNATYNTGEGLPNIYGIASIQAALVVDLPPETLTQGAISTESITLLPPFDEQGAAGTATGVLYLTFSYIGQGDLAGQVLVLFAKYEDTYVKTRNSARYGGWRISKRYFVLFVSCPKANCFKTQRGRGG